MIEFAAVIGYTDMEARGGWYLAPLDEGAAVPVVRRLPLPVTGLAGVGGRVGFVEHLAYLRDAVVARGFLDNTPEGRDHAGSLRLGLTRMVMEGETDHWLVDTEEEAGPVRCEAWRVAGASVQRSQAAAWDLPQPELSIRGLV